MEIGDIRKSLLETIRTGDKQLLRILHSIVLPQPNSNDILQWQKEELDRRLKSNEPGIPWEEVKTRIRANHKAKDHNGNLR